MCGRTLVVPALLLLAFAVPAARADDKEKALILELQKRREETEQLRKALDDRDRELLKLKDELARLKEERTAREIEGKLLRDRMDRLTQRVAELEKLLKPRGPERPREGKPAEDPPENVEGKVSRVDKETGLVRLTIGSDAGLKTGHVLHVYRIDAMPEKSRYLGKVEVVDVNLTQSVARPLKGGAKDAIAEGDRVASRLQVPETKP